MNPQVKLFKTYVMREVVHHGSLHHPFVVRIREVFLTERYLAIAMDFATGGDLFRHLLTRPGNRLAEGEARWIFQQLVIGLQYCHDRVRAGRGGGGGEGGAGVGWVGGCGVGGWEEEGSRCGEAAGQATTTACCCCLASRPPLLLTLCPTPPLSLCPPAPLNKPIPANRAWPTAT